MKQEIYLLHNTNKYLGQRICDTEEDSEYECDNDVDSVYVVKVWPASLSVKCVIKNVLRH